MIINADRIQICSDKQVFELLHDEIYNLEIKPGTRLQINEIAERLRVGRRQVHNALLMLVSEGIVEPNARGFRVIQFDRTYINQIYVTRRSLEMAALCISAEKRNLKNLETLRANCEAFKQNDPAEPRYFERYLTLDNAFHLSIARMTGNDPMTQATEKILWMATLIRRSYPTSMTHENIIATIDEHIKIIDALAKKNYKGALAALDAHLTEERDHVFSAFDGRPKMLESRPPIHSSANARMQTSAASARYRNR